MSLIHFEGQYGRPFTPHTTEGQHSVTVGAALHIPYQPSDAHSILMQATVKNLRYTMDGKLVPTGVVGFQLVAGDDPTYIELTPGMVLKFFGEDATSVLQYCWGL